MADIYCRLYPEATVMRSLFQEIDFRCENVIANPPFETAECTAFLRWLGDIQYPGDKAVLLLPLLSGKLYCFSRYAGGIL